MKVMRRLSGFIEKDNREVNDKHNYADDKEKNVFIHKLLPFVFSDSPYIDYQSQDSRAYIKVEKRHDFALDMPDNFTAMLKEPFRLMFGGMMRLMCYEVGKNGAKNSGSEKRKNSIDHVCTPFDIKKLTHKKTMNKRNPVNANAVLKLDAKNDVKVNATSERLAKSIAFSLYNLRWNSFISILESIAHAHYLSRENQEKWGRFRKNGTQEKWDSPIHRENNTLGQSLLFRLARNDGGGGRENKRKYRMGDAMDALEAKTKGRLVAGPEEYFR